MMPNELSNSFIHSTYHVPPNWDAVDQSTQILASVDLPWSPDLSCQPLLSCIQSYPPLLQTHPFFLSQLFLLVTLLQYNFTVGTRNSLSLLTSVCSLRLRLNLGMHLDLVHRQNFSKPLANLNNISCFLCHSCNSCRIRRMRRPGDKSNKYYEVQGPGHFFHLCYSLIESWF